jgi:predicted nucleotidyltransferase
MLTLHRDAIARFCERWKINELALFGSAARGDMRPESDVDILASFNPDADWSLFDHIAMEEELATIVGRKVDLVSRRAVERSDNWIRRDAILQSAEPFYVAGLGGVAPGDRDPG